WSLSGNISFIGTGSFDMTCIYIVAATSNHTIEPYSRVVVWVYVVIPIFRPFFDSRNPDRHIWVIGRRSIVGDISGKRVLHTSLFALFNLQKFLGNGFSAISRIASSEEPVWEVSSY